jgi:hypothetical protein
MKLLLIIITFQAVARKPPPSGIPVLAILRNFSKLISDLESYINSQKREKWKRKSIN